MKTFDTAIEGVKIIETDVFRDSRNAPQKLVSEGSRASRRLSARAKRSDRKGPRYFCEMYNAARYKAAGITADFVQGNEPFSLKGVVRNAPKKIALKGRFGRRPNGGAARKRPRLMLDDPALKIEWPELDLPILLSEKDQKHPPLIDVEPYEPEVLNGWGCS